MLGWVGMGMHIIITRGHIRRSMCISGEARRGLIRRRAIMEMRLRGLRGKGGGLIRLGLRQCLLGQRQVHETERTLQDGRSLQSCSASPPSPPTTMQPRSSQPGRPQPPSPLSGPTSLVSQTLSPHRGCLSTTEGFCHARQPPDTLHRKAQNSQCPISIQGIQFGG